MLGEGRGVVSLRRGVELQGPLKACGIILCAAFAARKAVSVRVQGEHNGTIVAMMTQVYR